MTDDTPPAQLLLAPGTDPMALATAGELTADLVQRAGRLGVAVPAPSADGYGLRPAEILEGLSDLADYDPAQALDPETGQVLDMHRWPASLRRALVSLSVETLFEGRGSEREAVGTVTKLKFAPRTPAYALLARFRGMEPKDKNADVLDDLAALVRDARAQTAARRTPPVAPSE